MRGGGRTGLYAISCGGGRAAAAGIAHTGAPVSLYALGVGAGAFNGAFDNTEIYTKLAALTGVK